MFVYTVYPTIPTKPKKKTTRQVQPVSRIKPVRRVEYNSDPIPAQQQYKSIAKSTSDIDLGRNDWQLAINELYTLNAQPLLLALRRPKVVVSRNYVQKYHERLLAIEPKNSSYEQIH